MNAAERAEKIAAMRAEVRGETAPPVLAPVRELRPSVDAEEEPRRLLPSYTLAEVIAANFKPSWLIEGWWPAGSYGMVAGQEKALKSYLATLMALAVASGRPFLGKFPVRRQGPVVVFSGEGSKELFARRMQQMAPLVGVDDLGALPVRIVDDVAPVQGVNRLLLNTLDAHLAERPALVILDPLYAYHGSTVDAGNVHAVGEMLAAIGGPCMKAGAALVVVNHFAKAAGASLRLAGITQAGSREWCDSWCLVGHREAPDVEAGAFKLEVSVGSRQGGGGEWDIDLTLGTHDATTFAYLDDPTLVVAKSSERKKSEKRRTSYEERIFDVLHEEPFALTRTEVLKRAGGDTVKRNNAFQEMVDKGSIVSVGEGSKGKLVWGNRPPLEDDPEAPF